MPQVEAAGARFFYRVDGPETAPVVILSHSLGCHHGQWDAQAAHLQSHFRVLRYDLRGHGASQSSDGDYSVELLARDTLAIADALGIGTFAFCGLSLGGMIGQWIAAHAPDRVTHAVLANTSSRYLNPELMEQRRLVALGQGMAAVADAAMPRFFTPESLAGNSAEVANTRRALLATNPVGYAGCCAAVRDLNQTALLSSIRTPVLIVSGDRDQSTPWQGHGDVLAREIAHASVAHLPAAHLSNLERPRSFNAALMGFLLPPPADAFAAGFQKRRAILGDAHVDRSIANTTDFTRAFQQLITRYAWGEIWQRPGLDERTRRLLVLATTAALGRWEEFRLHVRTGLQHELEPCDLEEVLLQVAIYAGVPAANTGFQIAVEEMR
ncbi:MAG TPA: alpha/beta fold hydrolase [Bryobacteraceae bacterium]|jgi:3-oxoadipate enol-lactonase/4-carboxymuconolactone decarboxylase|nr:alpha/beta fold hydrolase [Bryobacteraceae bacterium]